MAINWPNLSPRTKSFVKNPPADLRSNYSAIPQFQQTSGVFPGHAPTTPHTASPTVIDGSAALAKLPGILSFSH